MSHEQSGFSKAEGRLDEAFAAYMQEVEAGHAPDRQEFLAQYPELAEDLAAHEHFERLAAPVREVVSTISVSRSVEEPTLPPGTVIGEYKVLEEIGRHGQGVVYKARHVTFKEQVVALKMLLSGHRATENEVRRFIAEVGNQAKLDHSNIVPIKGGGDHEGRLYFTMKLIEGGNLAQKTAGKSMSSREAASFMVKTARAVHHAHQRRILHRDLKPSNILLDAGGEPYVADFGLSKPVASEEPTSAAYMVGAPAYMPPEQIHGEATTLSDVYGLGAIFYWLLTDRPPFEGETREEVLDKVREQKPEPPHTLNPQLDHWRNRYLELICLKCLEKDPKDRCQSAEALAVDLERWLRDEPLIGVPVRKTGRLRLWCRRHPAAIATSVGMVVLAIVTVLFGYHAWAWRQQAARQAFEKALIYAVTLDPMAETAIKELEDVGGSEGQVHMLRGLVRLYRGESQESIRHLKQAVDSLPNSVAARSMLAIAYNNAGQFGSYEDTLAQVEEAVPSTPEGFLFRGQAESFVDPIRGLLMLDEAVRHRNWVLARLIRSEVRTRCATFTAIPTYAELACEDAGLAKEMLPNNPVALSVSVLAHVVAARLFGEAAQQQKQEALAEADRDVQALDGFATLPIATMARWRYFEYIEDHDAAYGELRRASQHGNNPWIAQLYAIALYQRRLFMESLRALEPGSNRGDETVFLALGRAYILAELPNGETRAYEAYKDIAERHPQGLLAVFDPTILCLLGKKQEAIAASREIDKRCVPRWRGQWYHRLLEYNLGDLPADELLRAAGASKWNQCEAHYFIALSKLADGDRPGAHQHFENSVATRVFHYFAYHWSRAFLTRMDDPNWPPWIPRE